MRGNNLKCEEIREKQAKIIETFHRTMLDAEA
jgi:hypothetical protein